jgi:streptomycin 6-kinase
MPRRTKKAIKPKKATHKSIACYHDAAGAEESTQSHLTRVKAETRQPRMCHMSMAGLQTLSNFFQKATLPENEQENKIKLQPAADAAWAKLSKKFEQQKQQTAQLPCSLAKQIFPPKLRAKYEPLDTLSAGAFALTLRVFSLERNQNEVLKISQTDATVYETGAVSEFDLQKQAAALGLAPLVYDHVTFMLSQKAIGQKVPIDAIAMEEMDVSLPKAFECAQTDAERHALLVALNKLLKKMRQECVTHGDLHDDNVMLRYPASGPPEMLLIDWARAAFGVYSPLLDFEKLLDNLFWWKLENKEQDLPYVYATVFAGLPLHKTLRDNWTDWTFVNAWYEEMGDLLLQAYRNNALLALKGEGLCYTSDPRKQKGH